jgi:sulfate adenylyltransferase subunit 1 (EFTu-like GTPase family)
MMTQTNYLDMDLLRFTTAGSVDDGKSTLIGRLLYDSKSILKTSWKLSNAAASSVATVCKPGFTD